MGLFLTIMLLPWKVTGLLISANPESFENQKCMALGSVCFYIQADGDKTDTCLGAGEMGHHHP